jgi:antitoxin StbD
MCLICRFELSVVNYKCSQPGFVYDALQDLFKDLVLVFSNQTGSIMSSHVLTEIAASISELKANPMKVVASGEGMPIVVLNRNQPAFYCVPAPAYEAMMELIDDIELLKVVKDRLSEESVKVSLDDL